MEVSPFHRRPWMTESGAAAGTGSTSPLKGIVAGGITGGIEICITYPTEYVKTQLQLGGKERYAGVADVVRKTVRAHGLRGLYRGLSVLLLGSVPKSAIRFGAFETARNFLVDRDGNLGATSRALSGLVAGVCEAVFAVTPMETVKVKFINDLRSDKPRYRGLIHGLTTIVKQEGFTGLYQGVIPTVMRQGTNQAIRFFVMETLKAEYKKFKGDDFTKTPKYMIGIFGMIAGAASVYGNNPIDVVKTRMQGLEARKYKNTLDCFIQTWKNEGFLTFYKGTVPRLGRVCMDVAITFMLYETVMDVFNKIWP